jgi:hypothetical protein
VTGSLHAPPQQISRAACENLIELDMSEPQVGAREQVLICTVGK